MIWNFILLFVVEFVILRSLLNCFLGILRGELFIIGFVLVDVFLLSFICNSLLVKNGIWGGLLILDFLLLVIVLLVIVCVDLVVIGWIVGFWISFK